MSDRSGRPFDVVCMGRAAVDLYGEQIGGRLEDMRSFARYLGGSPANTAVGVARLGPEAGDAHPRRRRAQRPLRARDAWRPRASTCSHVTTDPKRLTALVFLGIRDRETFPLVFYRDNCADMGLVAGRRRSGAHRLGERACCSPARTCRSRGTLDACRRAIALARSVGHPRSCSTSTTGRCSGA